MIELHQHGGHIVQAAAVEQQAVVVNAREHGLEHLRREAPSLGIVAGTAVGVVQAQSGCWFVHGAVAEGVGLGLQPQGHQHGGNKAGERGAGKAA